MVEETIYGLRWIVYGRVQGVYFRDFTRREAASLRLRGWARNLPDGTVEVQAVGSSASLRSLAERLRQGPPLARVEKIAEQEIEHPGGNAAAPEGFPEGFEIRY